MKEKSKNIFEDSKNGTIGARIKVLLLKYDNNVSALEEAGKVGNGTLKTWKDKTLDFSTTIVLNFRKELRINPEWWETGKGEIYLGKGTHDDKPNDNTENMKSTEEMYRDLVERNTEYRIVPKTILDGEYRIMLESELTDRKKLYDEAIASKNKLILQLEKEIDDLRSGRVVINSGVPMPAEQGK